MPKPKARCRERNTRVAGQAATQQGARGTSEDLAQDTDHFESDTSISVYAPDDDIIEPSSAEESDEAEGGDFVWDDDEDCDDVDIDALLEVEDQVRQFATDAVPDIHPNDRDALFDGNLYPAEHFRKRINTVNPADFRRKEYAKGTEKTIQNAERQWIL